MYRTTLCLTGILLAACLACLACDPAEQYGKTPMEPLKATKRVESRVDLQTVRRSVQEFQAANGRYPADLSELAAFNGVVVESDAYSYDPATGAVAAK